MFMPEILVYISAILLGFIVYTVIMCYIFWHAGFNVGFNNGVKTTKRKQRARDMNSDQEKYRPMTQKSLDLNSHPVYIKRS